MIKIIILTLGITLNLFSQPDTNGEIDLSFDEEVTLSDNDLYFKSVVRYLENAKKEIEGFKSVQSLNIKPLSDKQVRYLNEVYVRCSTNKEHCKELLDTIINIDFIISKSRNKAQCNNMLRFWTFWVRDKQEEKQKHFIQFAHSKKLKEFKTKERKSYIRCQDKIKKLMNEIKDSEIKAKLLSSGYDTNIEYLIKFIKGLRKSGTKLF